MKTSHRDEFRRHHKTRSSVSGEAWERPEAFYCLVSGRVASYTVTNPGAREGFEFIHRGKHFGILSTLTGENHSHNFEAVNDSVVLRINREDFAEIA